MSQPYYTGQMQSPFDQGNQGHQGHQGNQRGSANYGQGNQPISNPFFSNAIGMIQDKNIQQMGANYLQGEFERRVHEMPSFSDYFFNSTIRSYFDIDNKYVLKKLTKIVFPFTKAAATDFNSTSDFDSNYGMSATTTEHHKRSLLTPDLYIPLMSFMTFILMVCVARGIGQEFNPDLISSYTINCLVFAVLEMFLYKLILLVVRVKTLSWLDLIAFLNYKFVGLCLILLANFVFPGWFTTVMKVYFSISFVYYMYAELRTHSEGVAEGVDIGRTSLTSDTIIYFLSGLQFATMWVLVLTMT